MQQGTALIIATTLAPVLTTGAMAEVIDEYKIKGLYSAELDEFLRAVQARTEVLMNALGRDLLNL